MEQRVGLPGREKETAAARLLRRAGGRGRLADNGMGRMRRVFGLGYRAIVYLYLIGLSFVFLYPFLYMLSTSFKSVTDLVDPTVFWIPKSINLDSYFNAYAALHYLPYLKNTAVLSLLGVAGQLISCSIVGYGFARFQFPGREMLFGLAMFTMIVPPQTIIIPLFIQFKQLDWINTYLPMVVPSFFAHGLRGALFIFIFRQFFRNLPHELEDAARVDGCGSVGIFVRIVLPIVVPALLVSGILSLVWHWNDFFEPSIYLVDNAKFTLPMMLPLLGQSINTMSGGATAIPDQATVMAACVLVLLPVLLLYLELQRYFMKSIERTGIVG
ncbi:carbohydrate ABC transporter permease [Paenibacillus flagellatus]|uniref:Carbohydrate ABC transporter permease n=1 Tax=Paenibacillus flagellatus TaxID=2211139 RepID=A0A2V5KPP6_9BACL|nr:carbohydrate ABC transporter permease [Paenibacillus flagellatus]PYI57490.1 carbohydrate ABC transporter permease [Paenibacillus flagellatus]